MIAKYIAKKMLTTERNDANGLATIFLTAALVMIVLSISWVL